MQDEERKGWDVRGVRQQYVRNIYETCLHVFFESKIGDLRKNKTHFLEFGEIYSFADLFGTKCVHDGAPILEKNPL